LRQARLELSEVQHLIDDMDDPDRRQQLARSARRLGAYLHAATVDSLVARPALDAERSTPNATAGSPPSGVPALAD
jgi:hypothetical protein